MRDIIEILKDSGIEVEEDKTTDLRKAVAKHYKTINEFTEMGEDYGNKLQTANDTIADLKGKLQNAEKVDVEALQQKIADYEQAEQKRKDEQAATKANASVLEFTDITGRTSKWYSEGTTWRDKPNSMESRYSKKSGTYRAEYKRKKK